MAASVNCKKAMLNFQPAISIATKKRRKRKERNETTNRVRRISFEGYIKKIRKFLERWKKEEKGGEGVGMQWRHRGAWLYLGQAPKVYFRCQGMVLQREWNVRNNFSYCVDRLAGAICIKRGALLIPSLGRNISKPGPLQNRQLDLGCWFVCEANRKWSIFYRFINFS